MQIQIGLYLYMTVYVRNTNITHIGMVKVIDDVKPQLGQNIEYRQIILSVCYMFVISIKGDFSSLLISQILRPSKDSPLNRNEDSFDLNLHCSSFS